MELITGREKDKIINKISLVDLARISESEGVLRQPELIQSMKQNGFTAPVPYDPHLNFVPDGNTRVWHLRQIKPLVKYIVVQKIDYLREVELREWERVIPRKVSSDFIDKWGLEEKKSVSPFSTRIYIDKILYTFKDLEGPETILSQLEKISQMERELLGEELVPGVYRPAEEIDLNSVDGIVIFLPHLSKELALREVLPPKTTRHIYDKVFFEKPGVLLDVLRRGDEDSLRNFLEERDLACLEKGSYWEGRKEYGRIFVFLAKPFESYGF